MHSDVQKGYSAVIKLFLKSLTFLCALASGSVSYAAEFQEITAQLNISHENARTYLDSRTRQIVNESTLVISNPGTESYAGPIRIVPNVTASGTVNIVGVDGHDESTNAPYYDLTVKTGSSSIDAGASVSFFVQFRYARTVRMTYSPTVFATFETNSSPNFTSNPPLSATVGVQYNYPLEAQDPDGDALTFEIIESPEGMALSSSNVVEWIPANNQIGSNAVVVRVTDTNNASTEQSFSIVVAEQNRAPVFTSQPIVIGLADEAYSYQVAANDPNEVDQVTITLDTSPQGMTINSNGQIYWLPDLTAVGEHNVSIRAADQHGLSATQDYVLTIAERNHPPVITSVAPIEANIGLLYSYQIVATDENQNDTLEYQLVSGPSSMSMNTAGLINWTPTESGEFGVNIRVIDSQNASADQTFTIVATEQNRAPAFTSLPIVIGLDDEVYSYQVAANDPNNGDQVTIILDTSPQGMTINGNGQINWLPGLTAVGEHSVVVRAADQHGLSTTQEYVLTITERNHPPVITSVAPLDATSEQLYSYQVVAIDENQNDVLEYQLISSPASMSMSSAGLINWTPTESGEFEVYVRVVDSQGATDEQAFSITVEQLELSDATIQFTSSPVTEVQVGDDYSYHAVVITSGNAGITYSTVVGPPNMIIDHQSGLIEWAPGSEDVGPNPVIIKAFDIDGNVAEQSFTILVTEGLVAPKIVSTPNLSVLEGRGYEYLVDVDPDSNEYSFSLKSSSTAAVLDSFGRLRWHHEQGLVNSLTSENEFCVAESADPNLFEPVQKWHWSGGQVRITPLVGQLSDDNDDGVINELDTPDVIFTAYSESDWAQAWMVALDGATGTPLATFEMPEERFHAYSHMALGDIDKDGVVEIISLTTTGNLAVYSHAGGEPEWSVELPGALGVRATPALYDLDGDGNTEILIGKFVFTSQGELLWQGEGDSSGGMMRCDCAHSVTSHGPNDEFTSFAMDFLSAYPGQEVIVGNQVYSASGQLLWTAEELGDGYSAMADLDGDGDAELVVQDHRNWFIGVADHRGRLLWSEKIGSKGGPVTLSDINDDGKLEIGFVDRGNYYAYSHDGQRLWQTAIKDASSGITGSTVFDFEGDGKADIVYFDEEYLRVFDETGGVKFQIPNFSGTWIEYPVIADIDNDGHADIVIPSSDSRDVSGEDNTTRGVSAFQDRYNTWPDTRSIWNQHAYHIDNINDDGSIPQVPAKSYLTHNTFRLSAFSNRSGRDQMDLVLEELRLDATSTGKRLTVNLVNRTPVDLPDDVTVNFYHGDPSQSGFQIGTVSIAGISGRSSIPAILDGVNTDAWEENIYAEISVETETPECISDNNQIVGTYFKVVVSDDRGRQDEQEFIVTVNNHNVAPTINSQPPATVVVGNEYSYLIEATDEDLGDKLKYSLVEGPEGMRIEPITGELTWWPTNQNVGSNIVAVSVVDTAGSQVVQELFIDVLENLEENRPPYFTNITTLYSHYSLNYRLETIDPDGDSVTIELVDGPEGSEIRGGTTLYWWHAQESINAPNDVYYFTVKVTDEHGLFSTAVVPAWVVDERIPQDDIDSGEVSAPEVVTLEDREYVLMAGANNTIALPLPDGVDGYNYELVSGPFLLTVRDNTIRWWPPFIGDYTATVRLTNGTLSYQYAVRLSVRTTTNEHPMLNTAGFPSILYVNEPFEYQFTYSDPNGDPVTFEVLNKPSNATIDENALLTWTPTTNEIGEQSIEILLTDSVGMTDNATRLTFEVREFRNRAPSFSQATPPHFAAVGTAYEYQFIATDPDGDDLTYSLNNMPSGAEIDQTGRLTINSITVADVNDYTAQVIATDPHGASETITFDLYVSDNTAPTFTTIPHENAHVGSNYWYGPRATDTEGHSYTFALVSGPDNLEFNEASSEINWEPTEEQIGANQIQISVTDQFGETNHQTFDVFVYSDQIMFRNVCPAPTTY